MSKEKIEYPEVVNCCQCWSEIPMDARRKADYKRKLTLTKNPVGFFCSTECWNRFRKESKQPVIEGDVVKIIVQENLEIK